MPESHSTQLRSGQYTISPELFDKGYRGGRGPCTCTSECCKHGVYADVRERDRILASKEIIRTYMDETQTTDDAGWFEEGEFDDPDFPSGRCVSTQVVNGRCAFLDKLGRCSLQVVATSEGMHRWALKPLFCILFPLEISNNVIGFDDLLDQEQECCSITNEYDVPVFEACRDELVHILGDEGFRQLRTCYQYHVRSSPSRIHEKAVKS